MILKIDLTASMSSITALGMRGLATQCCHNATGISNVDCSLLVAALRLRVSAAEHGVHHAVP